MKTKLLLCFYLAAVVHAQSQTITYANFSTSLSDTLPVNIADNSSFNTGLLSITGNGVTWDASALSVQSGTPTVNLSFHPASSTPYGSLYPSSNYAEYDPALTAFVGYTYSGFTADSLVEWGSYNPDGSHEIFQNPDKHLVFPFSYGQTFTDTYSKTNYSDATTISSYQNGNRTVTFSGFGTLILPQGTFTNVALVYELRTNSLGPNSTYYTWYDINTGKRLLYYSENNGDVTTVWSADPVTGTAEIENSFSVEIYPNPAEEKLYFGSEEKIILVSCIDLTGKVMHMMVENNSITIRDLCAGIYFLQITTDRGEVATQKFIKK